MEKQRAVDQAVQGVQRARKMLMESKSILYEYRESDEGLEALSQKDRLSYERGYGIIVGEVDAAFNVVMKILEVLEDSTNKARTIKGMN